MIPVFIFVIVMVLYLYILEKWVISDSNIFADRYVGPVTEEEKRRSGWL